MHQIKIREKKKDHFESSTTDDQKRNGATRFGGCLIFIKFYINNSKKTAIIQNSLKNDKFVSDPYMESFSPF